MNNYKAIIPVFVLLSLSAALDPNTYQSNQTCTYAGNCDNHHGFLNTNLPLIDLQNTHDDSIVKRFVCSFLC